MSKVIRCLSNRREKQENKMIFGVFSCFARSKIKTTTKKRNREREIQRELFSYVLKTVKCFY